MYKAQLWRIQWTEHLKHIFKVQMTLRADTHTIAISDRFRNRTTIIYSKWVCGSPCLGQGLASSSWSTAFLGVLQWTTESRAKGRCWAFRYVQSFYLLATTKRWSHKPMIWDGVLYIPCISDIFDTWILKTYLFFIGFTILVCHVCLFLPSGYCSWTKSCYLGWLFCDTTITIPIIYSVLRHVPTAG